MYYTNIQVVLQEVPGEISICLSICGCKLHCKGCHSPMLWKEKHGKKLTSEFFKGLLKKYKGFASCILFMGGEWHETELINYLCLAKTEGYKTCLYSGEQHINKKILNHLTWVKTGRWISELGGLDIASTNQKFIHVQSNKLLNHLFFKNH
ncbi:anaerobic ribonucleoside-triphosphate reductase activating protein [uncultured Formosa sp.]|uniref:anaerobic ribonucleoside-triphosphate reductase activating protein n=1 Tax=uncultured Formosa sp. TaxID=255435 RepID=UPI002639FBB4|nr:anaerobic ribonucleoside-triphosphate reductase activating protein [uncultured Formosa sp.]